MKYSLCALALVSTLSLPASADFLGGLNKAVNKANSVNTQAQDAATKAQDTATKVQDAQQLSAQDLLSQALESQLKPGVTTQQQVVQLLGEPEKVSETAEGAQLLQYKSGSVAEKVLTAQSIAGALGVQTPDLSGWLNLTVDQNGLLSAYQLLGAE